MCVGRGEELKKKHGRQIKFRIFFFYDRRMMTDGEVREFETRYNASEAFQFSSEVSSLCKVSSCPPNNHPIDNHSFMVLLGMNCGI